MAFPPYRIVVDSASEEEAQDMMWRALDGAVTIADRCLDVLGQVAPLRVERIAEADRP